MIFLLKRSRKSALRFKLINGLFVLGSIPGARNPMPQPWWWKTAGEGDLRENQKVRRVIFAKYYPCYRNTILSFQEAQLHTSLLGNVDLYNFPV